MKNLFFVLLSVSIGVGAITSCKRGEEYPARESVRTPRVVPDFELSDLKGNKVRYSDYKGKVVLVDFWATWCPPCRAEIPNFVQLFKKYEGKGLAILGISMDEGGRSVVESFSEEYKINYPILLGNEKVAYYFGGIRGIPTTFVINRNGEIVKKLVGYHDLEEFDSLLQSLL